MGAAVTMLGVLLSFRLDLPTGATIVCTFGISLLVLAVIWWLTRRSAAFQAAG
jgi:zinc/manganese transport system permease protein